MRSISDRFSAFVLPIAALAAGLLAAGILAGCDGQKPTAIQNELAQGGAAPTELRKVQVQLNWVAEPEFGGFYAAQQKALYPMNGLDVELIQGGPGVPAPQLVASGKVDFAIVSAPQLIELNARGGDLVALYAVYQGNPMGIMVHEASPYQSLGELWRSSSTVSIEQGLAEFRWLSKEFPGGNLKVVPYSANLAQFAGDPALAQQCFVISEPVTLELKGTKTRVFMIGDSGFDPYNAVLVTRRDFYEANKAVCASLVRATAAGWRAYLDDPKPHNETMARLNAGMSAEAMNLGAEKQRRLVETDETKRVGLGGMRREKWQLLIDQLVSLGDIKPDAAGKLPDPDTLFVWDIDAGTAR
jgi:NitT/TauT family transport system substrate-binding protein